MFLHYLFGLLAALASLLVSGEVIRRAPETIADLSPAERRRAWGLILVSLMLLIDAFTILKFL